MRSLKHIAFLAVASILAVPAMVAAQADRLIFPGGFNEPPGFQQSRTFSGLVFLILEILIAIVGLVAVVFLIIGGFRYITSSGNEEGVEKAKKTVINSLIGIVIVIIAFALVRLVANAVIGGQSGL